MFVRIHLLKIEIITIVNWFSTANANAIYENQVIFSPNQMLNKNLRKLNILWLVFW